MLVVSGGVDESDGQVRAGVAVESGLSAQESANRQAQCGPDELRAAPGVPAWRRLLNRFHDPLIYLLPGAVAAALLAWWVEGRAGHDRVWSMDAIVCARPRPAWC